MKTTQELKEYKESIEKECGKSTVLKVNIDNEKTNCSNTGNRSAKNGWSWIDYWRAMTGTFKTQLNCSSCGKTIFVGPAPKMMENMFVRTGDKAENHTAIGGHVWVETPGSTKYKGGRYITPLCPHCNSQHDKKIIIKKGSLLCKEVGAEVQE